MFYRLLLLSYACLNFIALSTGKTVITQPTVIPVYLKAGDNLDLLCQQFGGFKISWSRKTFTSRHYEALESSVDTGFVELAHLRGVYHLRLTKKNVQVSDSGSYKCSVLSGRDLPYAVDVFVLQIVNSSEGVVKTGNSSTLHCSLRDSSFKPSVLWHKGGLEVARTNSPFHAPPPPSSSPPPSYKFTINTTYADESTDSLLRVRNIGEKEVGEYTCEFVINQAHSFNQSVFLYSYPQIKGFAPSHNVVEGSRMEVECVAWGWPVPRVAWSRVPTIPSPRLDLEDDERVTMEDDNHTIVVEGVEEADRADYTCTATTTFNNTFHLSTHATVLVRVRGKWAPLIPLIGIVLEFVLLCGIIYVYERKKKKTRAERARKEALEFKQSQTPKQCTSPPTSSIRSRKSTHH